MVPPCRLKSVTIGSDMVVDSIAFSYSDCNGQQHTAGPWGGYRGSNYTIHFGPTEFLTKVSGTIGPFVHPPGIFPSIKPRGIALFSFNPYACRTLSPPIGCVRVCLSYAVAFRDWLFSVAWSFARLSRSRPASVCLAVVHLISSLHLVYDVCLAGFDAFIWFWFTDVGQPLPVSVMALCRVAHASRCLALQMCAEVCAASPCYTAASGPRAWLAAFAAFRAVVHSRCATYE